MVLEVLADRVELRADPPDPLRPTAGDLVATATPSGAGWSLRWQDGRQDELADRDAVQDLLIGHMRRR